MNDQYRDFKPEPSETSEPARQRPRPRHPSVLALAAAMMASGPVEPMERRGPKPHRAGDHVVVDDAVETVKRRDYASRELQAMADDAANGIPPAGSIADGQIRAAELSGDFERARALREEVKERAPDLTRLARAKAKRERRAKRRDPADG